MDGNVGSALCDEVRATDLAIRGLPREQRCGETSQTPRTPGTPTARQDCPARPALTSSSPLAPSMGTLDNERCVCVCVCNGGGGN